MFAILISLLLQSFFRGKTDFYFHQFLSSFFKYLSSNFLSFYLYNIFVIYFPSSSSLLKSFSSMSYAKFTYPENTFPQYTPCQQLIQIKPTFYNSYLTCNISYSSDIIIQVFCLP